VNEVMRSLREEWSYRAALRRRVVRRDRPSPSETLWRLAPPAALPLLTELLPVDARAPEVRTVGIPLIVTEQTESSAVALPSKFAADLVRGAALACADRLRGRAAQALVA